jgi:hypothetical protein
MEDIVKRLLFFALATLLLVPSAFGYDAGERFNFLGPGKWAQGRENLGIPLQPQVAASPAGSITSQTTVMIMRAFSGVPRKLL